MAKVIGIISIKGGVGKTSVVSALASSLANDFKRKILVIDANFSSPHLGEQIGLTDVEITLHHVLDGKANMKDAVYETGYAFDIIPGAGVYGKIDPFKLAEKMRDIRRKYDIILIDSSPNLNEDVLAAMIASDELIVVTTPDHITLNSTLRAIKIAKEKRTPIIGIIINKVFGKDFEIPLEDIEKISGCSVLAVLPHELAVLESLSRGMPSTFDSKSKTTGEYKRLAASLIGENYEEGGFKKFFRRFFHVLPKQEVNRVIFRKSRISNEIPIRVPEI